MGKIIIIAPHPDDEIFALRKLKAVQNAKDSVSILFLSGDNSRLCEAKESCNYLGVKAVINCENEENILPDGLFHQNIRYLIRLLEKECYDFDMVLAPALEGGHQDHDTTALAVLYLQGKFINKNTQLYFYPCYTSWKETFFFKVNSRSQYSGNLMSPLILKNSRPDYKTEVRLAYCIYKTQRRSWLLLYPVMLTRDLLRKPEIIYKASENAYYLGLNIINTLKRKPLYESHGRLKFEEWKAYVKYALINRSI